MDVSLSSSCSSSEDNNCPEPTDKLSPSRNNEYASSLKVPKLAIVRPSASLFRSKQTMRPPAKIVPVSSLEALRDSQGSLDMSGSPTLQATAGTQIDTRSPSSGKLIGPKLSLKAGYVEPRISTAETHNLRSEIDFDELTPANRLVQKRNSLRPLLHKRVSITLSSKDEQSAREISKSIRSMLFKTTGLPANSDATTKNCPVKPTFKSFVGWSLDQQPRLNLNSTTSLFGHDRQNESMQKAFMPLYLTKQATKNAKKPRMSMHVR